MEVNLDFIKFKWATFNFGFLNSSVHISYRHSLCRPFPYLVTCHTPKLHFSETELQFDDIRLIVQKCVHLFYKLTGYTVWILGPIFLLDIYLGCGSNVHIHTPGAMEHLGFPTVHGMNHSNHGMFFVPQARLPLMPFEA